MNNIDNPFAKIIFEFKDGRKIEVEPDVLNSIVLETHYYSDVVKVTIELFAPKALIYGGYTEQKELTVRNQLYLEDK